jgi:MFS superfamily sulfate permease-like transporter
LHQTVKDLDDLLTKELELRPLAALLGITLGSAVALFAGLGMTLTVFWLLPEFHDRLAGEFRPLYTAVAWAATLSVCAAAAFYAEIRRLAWRLPAQLILAVALVAICLAYWPK